MSTGPSLYRRHRPRTFADVVGQEHVVRTLSNAVEQGKVHHAYLFVGSRGTGKTSMAKILAACLNCVNGPTISPCGKCDSCVSIANATSLDVIEMDAASNNSVDDIRDLREKVAYAPVSGRHKVYILDEAHMLSPQAWNAFLKTLEEPPPRTIFVLATTEAQKVLPTVVDRCHRFDFGRPTVEQVVDRARPRRPGGVDRDRAGRAGAGRPPRHRQLPRRARARSSSWSPTPAARGSTPRPCSRCSGSPTPSSCSPPSTRSPPTTRRRRCGRPRRCRSPAAIPGQVLRDLEVHGRELLTVQVLGELPLELRVTAERDRRLEEQARALPKTDAIRLLDLVSEALGATADGAQARIQLELVLIKAAAPEMDPSTSALLARIERLEESLRAGAATAPAAASPPADPLPREPEAVAIAPGPATRPRLLARRAPARQRPAPSAALGLETAVSSWPAVLDLVRGENPMLAGALAAARPVAVAERELTLAFPGGASFLKRKAEQDDYRRVAAEALKTVTGHKMAFRYELRDEELEPEPTGEPALTGEELVRRFMEEFDAEELDVKADGNEASG